MSSVLGSCSPSGSSSPSLGRGDGIGAEEARGGGGDSLVVRPAIAQYWPHVLLLPGSSWLEIYTVLVFRHPLLLFCHKNRDFVEIWWWLGVGVGDDFHITVIFNC